MNNTSWVRARQVFSSIWERMLERKFFPHKQIIADLVLNLDFNGELASVIDVGPMSDGLTHALQGKAHIASVDCIQNLSAVTRSGRPHWDFIVSGPTGPWRIRLDSTDKKNDSIVADTVDIDWLRESLRIAIDTADYLLISRDVPVKSPLNVNGPGNTTVTRDLMIGEKSTTKAGNPLVEMIHLKATHASGAQQYEFQFPQHVFELGLIFEKLGLKICYETEYFFVVGKRAGT